MRTIDIRGIIVGSQYDAEWAADYIRRGIFTPESTVRRALDEAAAANEPVEVRICSQGGDVVAGGEIANAIRDYPLAKQIVLGSFAASMAANIVLLSGCPVLAHRNSILLYHGAWSVVIGGSGAMEDEARILDQINEPIKEALVARGIPRGTVERGFSEGRAYTMTAREALAWGIVDNILDDDAEANCGDPERLDADTVATLEAQGAALPVAAAAEWPAELPADLHAQLFDAEDALRTARAELDETKTALDAAREQCAELDALKATLAEAREKCASETARANALRKDLDAAIAAHNALTGRVLAPSSAQYSDWPAAVRALGLDEALRLFPALATDYRRAHARKPNN